MMDKPWFVRVRGPMKYQITPCAWQGWAVTAAFILFITGGSLFIGQQDQQSGGGLAAQMLLTAGASAVYLFLAVKMSVSADSLDAQAARRPTSSRSPTAGQNSEYWFVQRWAGVGATPATWQGWAVALGGVGGAFAVVGLVPSDLAKALLVAADIIVVILIVLAKTKGGWRRR